MKPHSQRSALSLALLALALITTSLSSVAAPTQVEETVGRYIVRFTDDAAEAQRRPADRGARDVAAVRRLVGRLEAQIGVRASARFARVFPGAAVTATAEQLRRLRADPLVAWVEADAEMRLPVTTDPVAARAYRRTTSAGLDRIDQRGPDLDGRFATGYDGSGVTIYVVGTGVWGRHREFRGGRVARGKSMVEGEERGDWDCNGHETHVASLAAGRRWGVARGAKIVPVRVYEACESHAYSEDILEAMEYILADQEDGRGGRAVANFSFVLCCDPADYRAMDAAVTALTDAGVVVVAAAANSTLPACGASPGRSPEAITVANMNPVSHTVGANSNYGKCVDLFAPGENIMGAGIADRKATAVMSGTSMAAPYVAGTAALLLQQNPALTVAEVAEILVANATEDAIETVPSRTPNLLLFAVPEEYED